MIDITVIKPGQTLVTPLEDSGEMSPSLLKAGVKYRVLVLITEGAEYHGPIRKPGIILGSGIDYDYRKDSPYPYVWDLERFQLAAP